MFNLLDDPHRRHLLLTLLVGVGLAAYVTGSVESIYGFDLAMVLTLVGGFPIYREALAGLARRRISADLAVSLAAFAALRGLRRALRIGIRFRLASSGPL